MCNLIIINRNLDLIKINGNLVTGTLISLYLGHIKRMSYPPSLCTLKVPTLGIKRPSLYASNHGIPIVELRTIGIEIIV